MAENVSTPPLATLQPQEAAALRAAQRAVADATRRAELAAARARVEVGEALEQQVALERELATRYGYDPDVPARLVGCALFAESGR